MIDKQSSKGKFQLLPTGGLGFKDEFVNDILHGFRMSENLPDKPEWQEPVWINLSGLDLDWRKPSRTHITKIDWLRCSFNGAANLHLVDDIFDQLRLLIPDIFFNHTDKKMLGYSKVTRLCIWQDNQLISIGFVGVEDDLSSSHCGICVDFTGVACELAQRCKISWFNWVYFIAGYRARITRADVALDILGGFAKLQRWTVPYLASLAVQGGLLSPSHARNKKQACYAQSGDWSCLTFGDVSVDDYNPEVHSPLGLTQTVGARTSPRYWRIYEKGKQLLGSLPDGDSNIDKWWIRVECEFKRDKDGADIPYELLLEPDFWFYKDRQELKGLFEIYEFFLRKEVLSFHVHQARHKKEKTLLLTKKLAWARRQYGRLVNTLLRVGFTFDDICISLLADKGLKDFIYDINADDFYQYTG